MVTVEFPDIMPGSIKFKNILFKRVPEFLVVLLSCKIKD